MSGLPSSPQISIAWPISISIMSGVVHLCLAVAQMYTTLWALATIFFSACFVASVPPCFIACLKSWMMSIVHILAELGLLGMGIYGIVVGFQVSSLFDSSNANKYSDLTTKCDQYAEPPLWDCNMLYSSARSFAWFSIGHVIVAVLTILLQIYICRRLRGIQKGNAYTVLQTPDDTDYTP
eukprot:TRINITY_DN9686_c0_g1_i2.p1 TRINITY_DN9686_c0_g1~~TRINITY_DN9686_c0_g1_i2.p1  ORF type:complete len:204 (-),score=35.46 TRINITY_DN9686_c0_g1_i2:241-780(-)